MACIKSIITKDNKHIYNYICISALPPVEYTRRCAASLVQRERHITAVNIQYFNHRIPNLTQHRSRRLTGQIAGRVCSSTVCSPHTAPLVEASASFCRAGACVLDTCLKDDRSVAWLRVCRPMQHEGVMRKCGLKSVESVSVVIVIV